MMVTTSNYYTQMNTNSFGTSPTNRLAQVITDKGSTVLYIIQNKMMRSMRCDKQEHNIYYVDNFTYVWKV